MSDMEQSLDEIGRKSATDKSSLKHGFLSFYERFLERVRHDEIQLLEIGVNTGASLRMWTRYFDRGRVVGVDIDPTTVKHESQRATVVIADQGNVASLVEIALKYGPFDIVIDDGSHRWDHQKTTLQFLLPFVKRGGFYILEDLDTSYGEKYEKIYRGTGSESPSKYLQRLCDYVVADSALDLQKEEDPILRSYSPLVEFVAFHRRTSLIRLRGHVQANASEH